MAMSDGMGVTPVYNLDRGNDGMFGGDGGGAWVFFLFFLLAWGGGNGFGFGNRGGVATEISNDFLYSNLSNQLGRLSDQNTFLSNSIQQGICNLGYENLSNFKDLQAEIASCCCNTQKELLINRYEAEKNTCAITNAIHADGEATRALLTQNTIQDLRDRLQAAELGLSQQAQTANIVSQVRPYPVQCVPFTPYGCGENYNLY